MASNDFEELSQLCSNKTLPVHTPWSKCCILVAPSAASQPGLGRQWLGCQKLPIRNPGAVGLQCKKPVFDIALCLHWHP